MKKVLREDQEKMIQELKGFMKEELALERDGKPFKKSILCQAPCGFGKSVVIAYLADGAKAKRNKVLFIVHTKPLIAQMKKDLEDEGVLDMVDVCSVQSLNKKKLAEEGLPDYAFIVTDEAHHAAAKTYQRIYKRWPDAFNIGFTATPCRGDKLILNNTFKHLVLGPSTEELIEAKALAQFKVIAFDAFSSRRDRLVVGKQGDYTDASLSELYKEFDYMKVVDKYLAFLDGKKTIVYVADIRAAKAFELEFVRSGLRAKSIYTGMSPSTIEKTIQDFKEGQLDVLCNVGMVGEGFNVPNCEAVMLLRPTKSLSLHLQQSMRCMRKDGNKVGIIFDLSRNVESICSPDADIDWEYYFKGGADAGEVKTRTPKDENKKSEPRGGGRKPINEENRKVEVKTKQGWANQEPPSAEYILELKNKLIQGMAAVRSNKK